MIPVFNDPRRWLLQLIGLRLVCHIFSISVDVSEYNTGSFDCVRFWGTPALRPLSASLWNGVKRVLCAYDNGGAMVPWCLVHYYI